MTYIPLVLGAMLLLVHLLSDKIHMKHKENLASFSVGISLTYIFLYLFPEMLISRIAVMPVFSSVLLGIAVIRLIETHVFRHRSKSMLRKELKEVHSVTFFAYHFLIGVVIFEMLRINVISGILFFMPILLHTAVSSISMKEVHDEIKSVSAFKILLALSTLIGISMMYFVSISGTLFSILLGFIVGVMLYIVIRDSMPKETRSKPRYFVAGIVLYSLLIYITTASV